MNAGTPRGGNPLSPRGKHARTASRTAGDLVELRSLPEQCHGEPDLGPSTRTRLDQIANEPRRTSPARPEETRGPGCAVGAICAHAGRDRDRARSPAHLQGGDDRVTAAQSPAWRLCCRFPRWRRTFPRMWSCPGSGRRRPTGRRGAIWQSMRSARSTCSRRRACARARPGRHSYGRHPRSGHRGVLRSRPRLVPRATPAGDLPGHLPLIRARAGPL